jgi:hypothetical protein
MTRMLELTRRGLLVGATVTMMDPVTAQDLVAPPLMRVSKDPNCGCCSGWLSISKQQDSKPRSSK